MTDIPYDIVATSRDVVNSGGSAVGEGSWPRLAYHCLWSDECFVEVPFLLFVFSYFQDITIAK